ncbi:carbohydrate-binding family 9-like protein [Fibrella sp. HMF5335]|uniref:Carbohydrate-binding family 9-like protein n=1 Tax=Fibrella rubiginis TaxID=2817060 RepID=A0A939GHN8_9BACT|nr:carbohydrate-binding family 9-like protein [Fibrella rubiginis]MBO0936960.1 carbohydrate-binding family 9-like protein [Fibrella rubiginis]
MKPLPYGIPESETGQYTCRKITGPLTIDGDLTKPVWQQALRSPRFVDMVTGGPALYDTRSAALWDDTNLYVAFWAEEPFVAATQTERDSIVFLDNDLELFIDGGDCYYELEVNALNTVYEVFFIWKDAYQKGGRFDVPLFDVHQPNAMTFGGDYDRTGASFWWGRHPRGLRWAFLGYDMPGLQTAVRVEGVLNDPTHVDRGWTLEIAIPWQSLTWLANGRSLPPQPGDQWRMFFGRFQKLVTSGQEIQPHPAWAFNKHGVYDTHLPECFTRVVFEEFNQHDQ